jgi:hypothetical protein
MELQRIDNVVFTVRDIDRACDFYARVRGVESVPAGLASSRAIGRAYRRDFEQSAIQRLLRYASATFWFVAIETVNG